MSSTMLLSVGLTAIGLAIGELVIAMTARPSRGVAAQALTAIETNYAAAVDRPNPAATSSFATLARWLRLLALRLSPSGSGNGLQRRLDMAGNPPRWSPDRYFALKGFGLVALLTLGGLYGLHNPALLLLYALVGGAFGFFLPDLLLYNAGMKRQLQIRAALPDALDMLTVCVEAGLGFDAGLAQVARNTSGPLGAEFGRALQEMQIGKTRAEALRHMADRTTVPELRTFAGALVQAGVLGIPIAGVLREQASEMRLRRRQRAEEKAQKVSVKILFPLVGCLFPALFVIVMGPGAITIMHALFGK